MGKTARNFFWQGWAMATASKIMAMEHCPGGDACQSQWFIVVKITIEKIIITFFVLQFFV
jgi:hypothetical protein